jgi:hypothetical protein
MLIVTGTEEATAMRTFTVTMYAHAPVTVQAATPDDAFRKAQDMVPTTGTGVVRDERGQIV